MKDATRLVTSGRRRSDDPSQTEFFNPPLVRGSTVLHPTMAEMRARVQRLVSSGRGAPVRTPQSIGRWTLDAGARSISYLAAPDAQAETHVLTSREFRLVHLLFDRAGHTVSRAHLLEAAGYETEEEPSRTLDSHIYRLRRKLQLEAGRGVSLRAVYGQGYCLDLAEDGAA